MWKYGGILSPKNHTRKIHKTRKDFQLYQVFSNNCLVQNIQISSLHIFLSRQINTFWSKGFDKFCFGNIGRFFQPKQADKKN